MDLSTYLYFDGECEAAFQFYAKVLNARIVMMLKYADAPSDQPVSAGTEGRIMHARLVYGGRFLMGSDAPAGRFKKSQGFSVSLNVDKPEEAERIFEALADRGNVHMPLTETFFAHRFAMLEDRFGTPWIIGCEKSMGETPAKEGGKPFVLSRTFDAPRDVVWRAFTDQAEMQKWWGPKGVEIIASKMDLRPGGRYHYGMRTADGKTMWGRMVYREIEPQRRLYFVNSFSDEQGGLTRHPMAPTWPMELLSTFTFEDVGGKTVFTVRWEPLDASPEERNTFDNGHASMTNGWTGTLDNLEAYLGSARR